MKAKIALIVCFYVAFFILSPPFQLPDEPDHYQYIYLLSRGHYPRLIPNIATQGNQKILQTMEQVFDYTKVASRDFALPDYRKIASYVTQRNMSRFFPVVLPALSKQGHQPPLYHLAGALFFKLGDLLRADIITQFYLVRLISALFYFLSVWLSYRLFRLLLQKKQSTENMTVFFAINPLVMKMGVTINPDIALLFFCLLFLFLSVNAFIRKKEYAPLMVAAIAGLAILTKLAGVFLIPFYVCYLILRRVPRQRLFLSLAVFLSGTFAVILPWLLFNMRTYGAPVIDNFSLICKRDLPHYSLFTALAQAGFEFRHTFMHYAGFWGWGEPYPFKLFFIAYAIVFAATVSMGVVAALKGKSFFALILTGFAACLVLVLYPVSLRSKLQGLSCDIQGRYLLPAFPALALIALSGIVRYSRSKEETVSRILMLFAIFQAQLVLWYVVIPKYYV